MENANENAGKFRVTSIDKTTNIVMPLLNNNFPKNPPNRSLEHCFSISAESSAASVISGIISPQPAQTVDSYFHVTKSNPHFKNLILQRDTKVILNTAFLFLDIHHPSAQACN